MIGRAHSELYEKSLRRSGFLRFRLAKGHRVLLREASETSSVGIERYCWRSSAVAIAELVEAR
jgi:hypothetical protein